MRRVRKRPIDQLEEEGRLDSKQLFGIQRGTCPGELSLIMAFFVGVALAELARPYKELLYPSSSISLITSGPGSTSEEFHSSTPHLLIALVSRSFCFPEFCNMKPALWKLTVDCLIKCLITNTDCKHITISSPNYHNIISTHIRF